MRTNAVACAHKHDRMRRSGDRCLNALRAPVSAAVCSWCRAVSHLRADILCLHTAYVCFCTTSAAAICNSAAVARVALHAGTSGVWEQAHACQLSGGTPCAQRTPGWAASSAGPTRSLLSSTQDGASARAVEWCKRHHQLLSGPLDSFHIKEVRGDRYACAKGP